MFVSTTGRLHGAKELRDAAQALAGAFDPSELSGDEAVSLLRDLARTRRFIDTLLTLTVAHIDSTEACRGRGDRSAADTAAEALGGAMHEARTALDAGRAACHHAELDRAARAGEVTPTHTAMIGAALEHSPGCADELLAAAQQGLQQLRDKCIEVRSRHEDEPTRRRRQRRDRSLSTSTDRDGMFCGRFRLEPHIGGRVKALLDKGIQSRIRAERRTEARDDRDTLAAHAADVLVDLILNNDEVERDIGVAADPDREPTNHGDTANDECDPIRDGHDADDGEGAVDTRETSGHPPNRAARRRLQRSGQGRNRKSVGSSTTVHVVIDLAALLRGEALPGERCEIPGVGPVNVAWVREILGESFLTAVIANGVDIHTVAHFGRHINATLRTALLVQGRECDIAGCGARGYLEIDHAHDHAKRGPTALRNLGWLCGHHHRLKTRGWILGPRDPVDNKRSLSPPRPTARAA